MKKHVPALLLLACAVLFGATFYALLRDRFESGDVYPPSSSLRSDPLGTMILFESLSAMPQVRVDRDYQTANRLPDGRRTAYLHLAASSEDWTQMPAAVFRTVDGFLLEGGRLVVILTPEYAAREVSKKAGKAKSPKKPARKPKTKKKDVDNELVDLQQKWGLQFGKVPGDTTTNQARNVSGLPLPAELTWHGDAILKNPNPSWQVIYKNDRGPVLAEKRRGAGSIVIATDSYFVSNEALVRDGHPELLAWLVGPADHIVFDEAHLGITDTPGIAALARKYRLHGGVLALLVLAGLFIWKRSSSLAPAQAAPAGAADTLRGRAAGAGFVSLLKRSISRDRILEMCLEEWRKTFGHGNRFTPAEKAAVDEIAREEAGRPARDRDPVAAYQRIRTVLHRQI